MKRKISLFLSALLLVFSLSASIPIYANNNLSSVMNNDTNSYNYCKY